MILVSSLYAVGPDLFQAPHGASMRHSLNVLAVQVNVWLGPSSARLGTVAPINNINAVNTVESRGIMISDEVDGLGSNECTALSGALTPEKNPAHCAGVRDLGKREDARELSLSVYGWFTEGFDTRDLKEAK